MTSSARALAVLAAIALALAAALVLGAAGEPATPGSRRVAEEVPARVARVELERGGQTEQLVRGPDGWVFAGTSVRVEPAAIGALLDTIGAATWHRREARAAAGRVRGRVRLISAAGPRGRDVTLEIGDELAGTQQTWIARGRVALLVDSWVVRALWPAPLALRVRLPLEAAAGGAAISIADVRVHRGLRTRPGRAWIDPSLERALVDALAALEVIAIDGMIPAPPGASITVETSPPTTVTLAGTCARGLRVTSASTGDGCVDADAWGRVLAAAAALARPTAEVADLRPVPFPPARVTLADGAVVELAGRPRVGAAAADADHIEELRGALTAPAGLAPGASPARPLGTLVASAPGHEDVRLQLRADGTMVRDDDVTLRPSPAAWAALTRASAAWIDPVRWREDALSVAALAVGTVSYRPGAVLGEWLRHADASGVGVGEGVGVGAAVGADEAARVDALARALAVLRARPGPPPARVAHAVSVTFAPPSGPPVTHRLEVGVLAAVGCAARVDGAAVTLERPLCEAVSALAAARRAPSP